MEFVQLELIYAIGWDIHFKHIVYEHPFMENLY